MATIVRHGATSHFMRPDRVMRTGVVQPVFGYNPAMDVMSVAQEFTAGPYGFRQLEGLGGMGLIARARLKFAAWRARRNAGRMMMIAATPVALPGAYVAVTDNGLMPNGSASQMAPQINAMPSQRVAMLALIAGNEMPESFGPNVLDTIANRWNGRGNR